MAVYWSILGRTGLLPPGQLGAVGVSVPEQKAKPRGAGTKSRRDNKSRAQSRQTKKSSSKSPGRTSARLTPSPADDGRGSPLEPLDAGPILDDLLDRVMTECALAAAARQVRDPRHDLGRSGGGWEFRAGVSALSLQRVPFTVSRARDAILFVAEWRFQVRDDGEPDPEGDPDPERDGVWNEDEEPETSTWDSWTPGVIPTVFLPSEQVRRSLIAPEPARAAGRALSPTSGPLCPPARSCPRTSP